MRSLLDRRSVAGIVLITWVVVLGWHVRREYYPPEASRLALGARSLPPGVAYYALTRGELRAGWAQVDVDTLPGRSGFEVRERVFTELPGMGAAGVSERATLAWLGPDLDLDSLRYVSVVARDTASVLARVSGDSIAWLRTVRRGHSVESRVPIDGSLSAAVAWPLRLAASGDARPGDRLFLLLLDPITRATRRAEMLVVARAARTYPDSADTDPLTGAWIPAREDTVQSWRVTRRLGGLELDAWVDEDGRVLETELAGGLRMTRTAFELAFFDRMQTQ